MKNAWLIALKTSSTEDECWNSADLKGHDPVPPYGMAV